MGEDSLTDSGSVASPMWLEVMLVDKATSQPQVDVAAHTDFQPLSVLRRATKKIKKRAVKGSASSIRRKTPRNLNRASQQHPVQEPSSLSPISPTAEHAPPPHDSTVLELSRISLTGGSELFTGYCEAIQSGLPSFD